MSQGTERLKEDFLFYYLIFILYWSIWIVDLQLCVRFRCIAKWFSYMYICVYPSVCIYPSVYISICVCIHTYPFSFRAKGDFQGSDWVVMIKVFDQRGRFYLRFWSWNHSGCWQGFRYGRKAHGWKKNLIYFLIRND